LKDGALNGPAILIPPGVFKTDLPADVYTDWQVGLFPVSPYWLESRLFTRAPNQASSFKT